jgi:excinuclease ABC subunit B
LRSARSLIQTIGRAARNVNGQVIMYADRTTDAMKRALDETDRRRTIQAKYNEDHGITPQSTTRELGAASGKSDWSPIPGKNASTADVDGLSAAELEDRIEEIRSEMLVAAEALEFEKAAELRDKLKKLEGRHDRNSDVVPKKAAPAKKSRMSGGRRR